MSAHEFIADIYDLANADGTPLDEVNKRVAELRGRTLWEVFAPPPSPAKGDLWFDTSRQCMYVWDGEFWILTS